MFKLQKEFQGDNKATTTNPKFIAASLISNADVSNNTAELHETCGRPSK
jgi:hypothetical protein